MSPLFMRSQFDKWVSLLPVPVRRYWLLGLALLLPVLVQLTPQPGYLANVAVTISIYMVLAMGLNIVVGMAGLLDLGYIAFFAVGAYTMAICSTTLGWSFWIILPFAAGLAALFGVLLGAPTLPLRGDYLAIVTLGFGEIIRIALNNLGWLTNGPQGILGIASPTVPWIGPGGFTWLSLDQPIQIYFVSLGFVALIYSVTQRLKNSRVGRAWVAIREDEIAAEAMGIDTVKLKLLAFASGAAIAGMIGVLFASQLTFVAPESFTLIESVNVLAMVVVGGMGSVPGAILGALLLGGLPEVLRDFAEYRMLLFGAAMVLVMLLRPQGLLGDERRAAELTGTTETIQADETASDIERRNLRV